MQFISILFLIAVGVSIPLFAMWGQGNFVDQKPTPTWARWIIMTVIALGLIAGGFRVMQSYDPEQGYLGGLEIAWIVGAAIACFVALQDRMKL